MALVSDLLAPGTLLDGAMGTELLGRGLSLDAEPPELWNLTRPDTVADVHARYVRAGSEAVQTNSFGGNRVRLDRYGLADRGYELNVAAARLARESGARVILGSMGPTGETPPPEGEANLVDMEQAFAEQALALAEGGVDVLHLETMYHPKEARAALRGCRIGAPGLPVIASMTCQYEGSSYSTGFGFTPESLLQVFLEERADGIGVNCSIGPATMLDVIRLIRTRYRGFILAKPTIAPTNEAPLLPGEFATGALALFAVGATAVGGCCGTGPADIAAARAAIDERKPRSARHAPSP
jgi:methionine synthase I (cobalamin-dependent)